MKCAGRQNIFMVFNKTRNLKDSVNQFKEEKYFLGDGPPP